VWPLRSVTAGGERRPGLAFCLPPRRCGGATSGRSRGKEPGRVGAKLCGVELRWEQHWPEGGEEQPKSRLLVISQFRVRLWCWAWPRCCFLKMACAELQGEPGWGGGTESSRAT